MEHRILLSPLSKVISVLTIIVIVSCGVPEATQRDTGSEPSVPSDFQLVIGEGGGFTGQWSGYTVDSAGTVFSWRGTVPGQHKARMITLSRPEFATLWKTIEDARFFETDTSGTGNMTLTMQVTAGGRVHRASWEKPADTRQGLAPVHVLFNSCRAIVTRGK